jgi:hypothetical protein
MDTTIKTCIITKRIWKLYAGEQTLWVEILRNKYLKNKDLLVDAHQNGSEFLECHPEG